MSRKSIHITIPDRLMERFEYCLEHEGLTKTNMIVSKIQEFCDKVEEKTQSYRPIIESSEAIENAMRQAEASLNIEGLYVSPEGDELIHKKVAGEISHEEFLKAARELATRE